MAFVWPAVATIASALISKSGASDANSANRANVRETNEFNAEQAQLTRDFNSGEAQISRQWSAEQAANAMDFSGGQADKQMAFQERMSNTSYQRAIGDMEKAGLNPMLAYHQGGAASPSGASGQSSMGSTTAASASAASGHAARSENEWAPALASATGVARTISEIENIEAQTDLTRQKTETEKHNTDVTWYSIREKIEKIYETMSHTDMNRQHIKNLEGELTVIKERQGIEAANMMLKRFEMLVKEAQSGAEINEAIAESKAWASKYGAEARPYVRDAAGIGGSAASVTRALGNLRNLGR